MIPIEVTDYRPDNDLDLELADVFYSAVSGWADGRPLTPSTIRGWLRPVSLTATTLLTCRTPEGRLVAGAALRWPGGPESIGQLWGPFVHPDARGAGLATALLRTADQLVDSRPGVRVTTVPILESRQAGWSLFERSGWHAAGKAALMTRTLPGAGSPGAGSLGVGSTAEASTLDSSSDDEPVAVPIVTAGPVSVRTIARQEYLDPLLTELVGSARPSISYASARDTFTRWSTDERYTPDGLLLAEAADSPGRILGAALIFPMHRPDIDEPAEALLEDLVVAGDLDRARATLVRNALVEAVVIASTGLDAQVARAFVDDGELVQALLGGGFEMVERIRYYRRTSAP